MRRRRRNIKVVKLARNSDFSVLEYILYFIHAFNNLIIVINYSTIIKNLSASAIAPQISSNYEKKL